MRNRVKCVKNMVNYYKIVMVVMILLWKYYGKFVIKVKCSSLCESLLCVMF